ncbi:MAG: hypothetical protein AB7V04_04495 [Desulfomonilaceae bacterium]
MTEKTDSGPKRQPIIEEDITDNRSPGVSNPAPSPSAPPAGGVSPPGSVPYYPPSPTPDDSTKTPRRFHWKDNR